eukprot:6195945-Pleurochrysis_carterae.AAC.2
MRQWTTLSPNTSPRPSSTTHCALAATMIMLPSECLCSLLDDSTAFTLVFGGIIQSSELLRRPVVPE